MEYKEALKVITGDRLGFKHKVFKEVFGDIKIDDSSIEKQLEYLRKTHVTVKDIDVKGRDIFFSFYEIPNVVHYRDIGPKNTVLFAKGKSYKI